MSQIVLLAEDEPLVSNFVSLSLERAAFVIFLACNAEKALQVFRNETIDLLLTDVHMGDGMNTKKLEALRGKLDQLQRSRKSNNP
jgi:DNA-binding response OmpR family regulator